MYGQDTAAVRPPRKARIAERPLAQGPVDGLGEDGPNISVDAERNKWRGVVLGWTTIDNDVAAAGTSGLQRYVGRRRHHERRSESEDRVGSVGSLGMHA